MGPVGRQVRERAERRLVVTDLHDQRVLSDPEYGQALDAGGVFAEALRAAEAVLRAGVPVLPASHKKVHPIPDRATTSGGVNLRA